MESKKVDVLVLGAGIVGISLAHELQRSGRQVLVIDRGETGYGSSYGNAGWITPCFSMPLPQPGMFLKSIGWLLKPDSPLYIKPQPSLLLARWMMRFLTAMNNRKLHESVTVLAEISKYSLNYYRDFAARSPDTVGFDQKGLLLVSATDAGLDAAEKEMKLMSDRGIPGERLSGEQVLALEPSLKPKIRGGVYFSTEGHAEPLATVKALARDFEAIGGKIQTQTEVYDFEFEGDRISEVLTTRGRFKPDLVVFSMGAYSRNISKKLGVSVPVLGGKGYSLIVESMQVKPQHPIMIVERKIAVTPRADSVRLAGTLELVDRDDSITPRRVRAILEGSQEYMHVGDDIKIREVWRGLRPCTPDGVPMIGFSKKVPNLFYNLGHQMLGFQSAPGSARLAADLIAGRSSSITDVKPFSPSRFE